MKVQHIVLTIAAAAVLAAPTTVLAQTGPGPGDWSGPGAGWGGGHGPHNGPGGFGDGAHGLHFFERMLPRLADDLGLTDEQLEKIQSIVDEARSKIEEAGYVEKLRAGREAYLGANDDPTVFDEEAFRAHAAAQHHIQTELGAVVGQAKADAFKVLTPEQLSQLEAMRGSFGRRSFRGGGGPRSGS